LSALHLIVEKIPLFVLAAASSAVTFTVQQRWGAMKIANVLPLHFRTLNALVSYIRYIGKMIYPGRLAVMYLHPGYGLPIWQPVVALAILAGVTAGVIYTVRRRPYLAVGWLWYLGTLVPVIGLIQVGKQAMADRYTYLPSIGFFIMIAYGAVELFAKWRLRKIVLVISAGLVLAALMLVTRMQVRHWRNNLTLYEHTLAVTENNAVMHNDYGTVLLEAGQFDKAVKHFNEALRIYPQYLQARKNIAMAYIQQGKLDQAAEHFNEARRIYPQYLQSHENIAKMFLRQGKKEEARQCLNDLLRIKADWAAGYYKLGLAYARLRQYDLAVQNYKEALQLNPNFIEAINNLAVILSNRGRIDEAIEKFEKALLLKPDDPFAHFNLGIIMVQQGKYDDAVKHYNEALQAKPDWPKAQNNLAWLLTVQARPDRRNAEKALTLAKQACELTNYKQPVYLRTLAAAYAATGQFPEAVSTAEQAIQLALSFGQKELAENIQNQLKLYRAKRPYHLSQP
jgi:tetratricopeptide (TPR) repeat protein